MLFSVREVAGKLHWSAKRIYCRFVPAKLLNRRLILAIYPSRCAYGQEKNWISLSRSHCRKHSSCTAPSSTTTGRRRALGVRWGFAVIFQKLVEIVGNERGREEVVLLQQNFCLVPAKASQKKTETVFGACFPDYVLFLSNAQLLGNRGTSPLLRCPTCAPPNL